jgi:hypothetical protein
MRLLMLLIGTVCASVKWPDFSDSFPGDYIWDATVEGSIGLVGETIPPGTLIQPNGGITKLPRRCTRAVVISTLAEYEAAVQEIQIHNTFPDPRVMLRSQRVSYTDPRYDSLRYAFRKLRQALEVSDLELRALLDLNENNAPITEVQFIDLLRSRALVEGGRKCALMVWFLHVINPVLGKSSRHLEVSAFTDKNGVTVFRPTGDALNSLLQFELDRIHAGDTRISKAPFPGR